MYRAREVSLPCIRSLSNDGKGGRAAGVNWEQIEVSP